MANPNTLQLDLFEHVAAAYAQTKDGMLSNQDLYRMAVGRAGKGPDVLAARTPVGRAATPRNLEQRKVRWHQQTLKKLGLIEHVEGARGMWQLTEAGKQKLRTVRDDVAVLAVSTDLGVAILGNCRHVFDKWDEPIFLVLTSPPYPLQAPRAYGNPPVSKYVDFICELLEPLVRNLAPGGSVVLSLSNDIFEPQSPARSLYLERLTIALADRFNLSLMDRLVWESNKPPGPIAWASKKRMQLNTGYEPILWFCNDPNRCVADNRRVLEPHTDIHKKLIHAGGEKRSAVNCDGAHRIRQGSYGAPTEGRIPRNIFHVANTCASQRAYKRFAESMGLRPHGAPMPLALARKLVRFLTDVGQLVADPCAGSLTTPLACELEDRPWVATERVVDYMLGGAGRLVEFAGHANHL